MTSVLKAEVLNIRYNTDIPNIPLQCATSIYFPTSIWSNDPKKVVNDAEASTYKVRIEGSIYGSDTLVSRNRMIVGNTITWTQGLPPPINDFQAFVDGDMYISGRLFANSFTGQVNFSFGTKTAYAIDYQNTVSVATTSKFGRFAVTNIRAYDMFSKKRFVINNPDVSYNSTDETKRSYVFLTVTRYTASTSTPVVSVTGVTNGSFTLEISNFIFSPTTTNITANNGEMDINYLVV